MWDIEPYVSEVTGGDQVAVSSWLLSSAAALQLHAFGTAGTQYTPYIGLACRCSERMNKKQPDQQITGLPCKSVRAQARGSACETSP
jgi:hypothetical protein